MKKTISVFFSGTGFSIDDSATFLAANLYECVKQGEQQIKMGFDGCGVEFGLSGIVFGSGLDEQCDRVIQRIIEEIEAGNEMTLNVYGHSRGAVGALMLAQQLSAVDPKLLSINMALLDPVPGNLITTSTFDPFNISLANKTMDLTDCKPLKKVLALYPHEPLPAFAFHAPLIASYPEGIELDEDVIGGCHAEAEQLSNSASTIASLRISEFLTKNGTKFNSSADYTDNAALNAAYLQQYKLELDKINKLGPMTRDAHSAKGVYINAKTGAQYFNEHHKRLAYGSDDATVALTIEPSYGPVSLFKRATATYPVAWQILKWSSLSIGIACLLFFTGGLAAIASLGAFSIVAAAPVIGGALATLWYGAIKPGLLWATNRIFYPSYSIREINSVTLEAEKESTDKLLDVFSGEESPKPEKQLQPEAPYHGRRLFDSKGANHNTSSEPAFSNVCTL
ncbi:alpha/beta hydrolase [Legionella fallonii]|uniref:Uncharacterized protein n=1 Tax=Legionella fallonii LLAP-10 TaxID=1212491 RepID=A0A098G9U1_9GAMM|nr:alpha/beta hydrolase [Legionella fallonii]CEG58770.1 conserved protein of unknown function [Legionella fallonii LLAP-10]